MTRLNGLIDCDCRLEAYTLRKNLSYRTEYVARQRQCTVHSCLRRTTQCSMLLCSITAQFYDKNAFEEACNK